MTVSGRAVRGAFFLTASSYLSQIMGFLASLVLLRLLDPVHYGFFGLALVIVSVFNRVKVWGFNQIVIATRDVDHGFVSTQFWLSMAFSTAVVLLIAAAYPLLILIWPAQQMQMAILIAAVSILEAEGLASTPETMLRRDLRFGTISALNLASIAVSLLVTIGVALWGPKYWALFWGFAAKTGVYCVGVWVAAPLRPGFVFVRKHARYLIKQGKQMLWGGLGTYLAYQYDDLMVGLFAGNTSLGLYRTAYNWSLIPLSLVNGMASVMMPTYAKVIDDRQARSQAVTAVLTGLSLIALPGAIGLAVIAEQFVLGLYEPKWLPAVPMLRILMIYSLLRPILDSLGGLAAAFERYDVLRRMGVYQSIVMIVSCTLLTWQFGAVGAGLSAGLTVAIGLYLLMREVIQPHIDLNYWQVFGLPVMVAAVAAAVTLGTSALFLPELALLALIYKIVIFAAVYLGLTMLFARERMLLLFHELRAAFVQK